MSDNEEFLGDDFGDPSCDDTYTLGNEEEEILLAGGNIDCISRNELKIEEKIDNSNNTHHIVNDGDADFHNASNNTIDDLNKTDDTIRCENSIQNSSIEAVGKLTNDEETAILNDSTANSRYRADQKERFPTERSELHGVNVAKIPDSLDTVVTAEASNQQFRNKRQNGNRGRRLNVQRPMKDMKRPDFQRMQNFKHQPDNFGRLPNNFRHYPPDFRPYQKDMPPFRNVGPPHDFHGGDFNMSNNPGFRPSEGSRPGEFRPMELRSANFRNEDGRPFHNMNSGQVMGPNNIRPPMDMRSGPPVHRDFMPVPPRNPFPDNFAHQNRDNAPFQPLHNNIRPPNDRFMPMSRMGNVNNYGPPNIGSLDDKVNHPVPPFHGPKNFSNMNSDFAPRNMERKDVPNNFDQSKADNHKMGNTNESKKVLINPHFKGVVPTEFMQSDRPSTVNNFETFGNNPYNANSSNYPPNRSNEFANYRTGEYNRAGHNDQVNEKELQRLTEQFINEQQRCLRLANADYYEKTQRFIENTSLNNRPQEFDDELERKKEYLKRKQEEFITENDKFLNLRRRKISPPRSIHRSPLPISRHRTSPGRRMRGRLSISPTQNRREQSGEPEDKAYRVKLREQAEMRARVLQAKERRRRRDAANLLEKMNQPSAPTSPKSEKNQNTTALTTNDKKMESDSNIPNKDNFETTSPRNNADLKDSGHGEEPVNNQPVEEKHDTKKVSEKNDIEKPSGAETIEDILDDDLLHLSPEDEELLLSDEELILPTTFTKTINANVSKPEKSPENNHVNKGSTRTVLTPRKSPVAIKRTANIDMREDLRTKLIKFSDVSEDKPSNTQTTPPRRKIMFSNDLSKESSTKSQSNIVRGDKKEPERGNGNKWRSTFSEQKLDLTAPVAARAISAVMRNSTDNKKTIGKNDKTSSIQDPVDVDTETKSNKLQNGSDTKQWNRRQVVVAKSARRVVIPPRQKPLVVIENDEEEPQELCEQVNKSKNKKMALVTGLPPGMTEARLLSLCGPEVEHVSVGAAGSADVSFNTAEACDRFIRRFHGRLVAACRLTVTAAN